MFQSLMNLFLKGSNRTRYFSIFRSQLLTSQVQLANLGNGIRIASQETDSALACTSLFIKTGSRFENECNNGITHFIEHMAYQGFTTLSKYDLQKYVSSSAVKLTSITSREYQIFTAISSGEYARDCVNILIKILIDLQLCDSDIELQKESVYFEALDNDKDPKSVVFNYLNQTAFQGTPLAQSVIGPNSTRMTFDRNMICDYIERNYQPHRVVFASSGCISHISNMCEINNRLGNLLPPSISERAEDCYKSSRYTGSSIIYRDDSMPYAHVALAVEVPGYDSPEYLPLLVASCLTGSWERTQGGTDRHASPLARAAATSKLCEMFDSFYISYQGIGLWGIYFIAKRMDLDNMILNIQDQWMQMCTSINESDVQRALNLAKYKLASDRVGVVRSCKNIGLQLLNTSNWKPLADVFHDMKELTCKDIRKLGRQYIYDKCPVLAAVGPSETLPEYNRLRAGMYWLRV